jgi:tetratricopeptide (TPR) repeat protein
LAGSAKGTEQAAEEIRQISGTRFHEKESRRFYHLAGWIEQKKNNLPEAIKLFEQSKSLLPFQYCAPLTRARFPQGYEHAFYFEPLAAAYYKAGQLEKARRQYEEITTLTMGRIYFGDLYARSFYMLGKINQELGRKAEALEYYGKFLDLWKDADPGLPEVEDARKRLAGLQG